MTYEPAYLAVTAASWSWCGN